VTFTTLIQWSATSSGGVCGVIVFPNRLLFEAKVAEDDRLGAGRSHQAED
jgi:hypothetical protein